MEKVFPKIVVQSNNASFYVSKKTKQFIEKQSEDWLTVLFLPTRAPFLNIVETKVNRNLKKDICANYTTTKLNTISYVL